MVTSLKQWMSDKETSPDDVEPIDAVISASTVLISIILAYLSIPGIMFIYAPPESSMLHMTYFFLVFLVLYLCFRFILDVLVNMIRYKEIRIPEWVPTKQEDGQVTRVRRCPICESPMEKSERVGGVLMCTGCSRGESIDNE